MRFGFLFNLRSLAISPNAHLPFITLPLCYISQLTLGMAYRCTPCDRYFGSQQALQQHLNSSAHNFDCDECDRSFGSQKALQQHLDSPAHIQPTSVKYTGIPRSVVSPVYVTAFKQRFTQPTVDDILRLTKTKLEIPIVTALISAALRLLPVDNTLSGIAERVEKHRIMAAEAKRAEDSFCLALSQRGLKYVRESQQQGETATPDIRLQNPTIIYGHLCFWLEFKNYFGFRENPFLASKNKKQFQKYATQIGPGAVVYKLGFEIDHINIDGVIAFREKEVLQDLGMKYDDTDAE